MQKVLKNSRLRLVQDVLLTMLPTYVFKNNALEITMIVKVTKLFLMMLKCDPISRTIL